MKKNPVVIGAVIAGMIFGMSGHLCAETSGPTQAGVAASVEGEVKATTPPEKSAHFLKDGDQIFMGDKIETGAVGQLQIQLLDETVFTLGPLSAVTIDEFVYDPENAEGKANTVKGIFRAVSGKVAQQKPEDMPGDFSAESKSGTNAIEAKVTSDSFSKAQEDALKLAELIGSKDVAQENAQRATRNEQR